MFEELAKKFEEIITAGIKDIREDVDSIKVRIESLEGKVFAQGIAPQAQDAGNPEQLALITADDTTLIAPTEEAPVSDVVTPPEATPSLENIPA